MSMSSSRLIFFNTLADGSGGSRTCPESVATHKAQTGTIPSHLGKRFRLGRKAENIILDRAEVGCFGNVIVLQSSLLVVPKHGFAGQFCAGFQAQLLLDAGIV